jgi:ATP/maltotriose-dependent transcriptional regulator MalT
VFDNSGDYQVLKKCSVCDILYPALCGAVTGQKNAWKIITAFAGKTGLLIHSGGDIYRFHTLLKEFLESELLVDDTIDKPLLYKTAAQCFKNSGDILRAINMAAKSRDIALVEEYLRVRDEYGKYTADAVENTSAFLNYIYSEMPASVIKQSLRLSAGYVNAMFCSGKLHAGYEFLDSAFELMWADKDKYSQTDLIGITLLKCTDPRGKISEIPELFRKAMPFFAKAKTDQMSIYTVTLNFSFFHRAAIDFSDASPNLDGYLKEITKLAEQIAVLKPLVSLIEAGLCYERGELERAEKVAEKNMQMAAFFPPEIRFCSMMIYAEIMRVQGKGYKLEPVANMIAKTKANYLYANFNAYTTNIQLYNGDTDAAKRWLPQTEVEDVLRVYKFYQYITTARSLLVLGRLPEAEALLVRLIDEAPNYRRPSDLIEALALRSVCLWHMKRQADSIQAMIGAINKACELQLLMPVIKEGGDIGLVQQLG